MNAFESVISVDGSLHILYFLNLVDEALEKMNSNFIMKHQKSSNDNSNDSSNDILGTHLNFA